MAYEIMLPLPWKCIDIQKYYVYFGGKRYKKLTRKSSSLNSPKESNRSPRGSFDTPPWENYCYLGTHSKFLGSHNEDFGYKIFNNLNRKETVAIFKIQDFLYNHGFAPKVYDILTLDCYGKYFQFAIKMDNIKGKHASPDPEWINALEGFCVKNNISRPGSSPGCSIRNECKSHNCRVSGDGNTYLVDIDKRWRWNTK
jgi:hypothetical protein